tara:strand:- start:884 stop:1717 length:834 start_codon:yes stop_codon:yes gene_type:complete
MYKFNKAQIGSEELLVSIIMPSYNSEKFIKQSISSVLDQGYKNWELLIVDGMSNDSTREIIKKYQSLDSRICLIDNPNDGGPGQARNLALNYFNGDFIAFIDSDDLWTQDKLKKQLKFMVKNDFTFTYTDYKKIDENNKISNASISGHESNNFHQYLRRRGIANSSVIIRADIILEGIFDEVERMYAEDTMWWLILLKNGNVAFALNKTLMLYRTISSSRSSNIFQNQKDVWNFYLNFLNLGILKSIYYYFLYLIDVILRRIKFKFKNELINSYKNE